MARLVVLLLGGCAGHLARYPEATGPEADPPADSDAEPRSASGASALPVVSGSKAATTAPCDPELGGTGASTGGIAFVTVAEATAAAADGDVVHVCPGTYAESLVLDRPVVLVGLDRDTVVLDGGASRRVVDVTADGVTLASLTIAHGQADDGAGLRADGVQGLELHDLRFDDNRADGMGGGAWIRDAGPVAMIDLEVEGNTAHNGGGLALDGDTQASLERVDLRANEAENVGGGLWVANAGATASCTGCVLFANLAGDLGGGLFGSISTVWLTDSSVHDNVAVSGTGGGVHASVGHTLVLDRTDLQGNSAGAGGGGAWLTGGTLEALDTAWGTGPTDNAPDDIASRWFSIGDVDGGERFACDDLGCR